MTPGASTCSSRPSLTTGNPVGYGERRLLVVSHEYRGGAACPQYAGHLPPHLAAQPRVQVAERLVQQHGGWPRSDGACKGDPLLLAAGELVWVSPLQAAELHKLDDLCQTLIPLAGPKFVQAEGDVLRNSLVREEGVLLEDHAHVPAVGGDMLRRPRHHAALDADLPSVDPLEPGDETQKGGLAGPAWAEDGEHLSRPQGEADSVHRGRWAKALGNGRALYDRRSHSHFGPRYAGRSRVAR